MRSAIIRCLVLFAGAFVLSFAQASLFQGSKPVTIKLANDHQAAITLSSKDVNRIFVAHDKITSFNAPNSRLIAHNDQSGSVYMNVTGEKPFAVYITTKKERHFSLLVTPRGEPGVTLKLIPATPVSLNYKEHQSQAKHFEASSPYEKTLVTLLRKVMRGEALPGYSGVAQTDLSEIKATHVSKHLKGMKNLSQKVEAGFLGGALAVRVLRVTNDSKHAMILFPRDFYLPEVRAVSIIKEVLGAGQSTQVYEVVSNV